MVFLTNNQDAFAIEDEACELSVLTRGTTPSLAQSYVPLKCRTKKICLTQSFFGGECLQFAGEENVEKIRLPNNVDDAARKIEEISANVMYSCWDMMGQGKIDLFGNFAEKFGWTSTKPTCVICSRVAIDKDVNEEILKKVDINKYLEKNNVPGQGITYLQAFTNRGASSFVRTDNLKPELFDQRLNSEQQKKKESVETDLKALNTANSKELAFVFMQIKTKKPEDVFSNIVSTGIVVGAAGVGAFMIPFIGHLAGVIILGGDLILAPAFSYVAYENLEQSQIAAAGYCGEFQSSKGDTEKGCSILQAVPYDFRYVNNLCDSIQGQP